MHVLEAPAVSTVVATSSWSSRSMGELPAQGLAAAGVEFVGDGVDVVLGPGAYVGVSWAGTGAAGRSLLVGAALPRAVRVGGVDLGAGGDAEPGARGVPPGSRWRAPVLPDDQVAFPAPGPGGRRRIRPERGAGRRSISARRLTPSIGDQPPRPPPRRSSRPMLGPTGPTLLPATPQPRAAIQLACDRRDRRPSCRAIDAGRSPAAVPERSLSAPIPSASKPRPHPRPTQWALVTSRAAASRVRARSSNECSSPIRRASSARSAAGGNSSRAPVTSATSSAGDR